MTDLDLESQSAWDAIHILNGKSENFQVIEEPNLIELKDLLSRFNTKQKRILAFKTDRKFKEVYLFTLSHNWSYAKLTVTLNGKYTYEIIS